MLSINIYDDKEIDTDSEFLKDKICEAVSAYIKGNWNKCVNYEKSKYENEYHCDFTIEL